MLYVLASEAYNRLLAVEKIPLGDFGLGQVDQAVVYPAARSNHGHVGNALGARGGVWGRQPCRHLGLARLLQGHDVEEDIAVGLLDSGNGRLDLVQCEGVERMGNVGHD